MDLTTKTAEIAKILIERGETVAVGESSAGGLVSASLLAVPAHRNTSWGAASFIRTAPANGW